MVVGREPGLERLEAGKGGQVVTRSRFSEGVTGGSPALLGSPKGYRSLLVAAALTVLVVVWASVNLWSGGEGFALLVSDGVVGGEEAASALARLFAALVLGLFLADAAGVACALGGGRVGGPGPRAPRLRVPGAPDQADPPELNESLYEGFVTQTLRVRALRGGAVPG